MVGQPVLAQRGDRATANADGQGDEQRNEVHGEEMGILRARILNTGTLGSMETEIPKSPAGKCP